ncbi:hypothetical protein KAM369_43220 [Aeromonas caviae]|uniref:Uncharacterized protein n=1 Tax=Aeromonas caviae TaxID=648 RepID=A0ABD0BCK3_AERCA|nr:hypothetical protein KAM362_38930 [Aeromonas caviae]GJB35137.1 hypothetical protein KAM367_42390 [Aeromonas caviae]GJB43847.1 hypothetical protein KAM369_43220 [Aeromonas caviae]GJB66289.1 hypothetical protein KAM375_43430 [Aeromonas caviae]GJB70654.1 hypothetical protein KAM378_41850 [Aeromonas caviae]
MRTGAAPVWEFYRIARKVKSAGGAREGAARARSSADPLDIVAPASWASTTSWGAGGSQGHLAFWANGQSGGENRPAWGRDPAACSPATGTADKWVILVINFVPLRPGQGYTDPITDTGKR